MTDTEQIRRAAIKAGLMGTHGTSVPMHKLEAFADYLLDEENEVCATKVEHMGIDGYGTLAIAAALRERRKA